MTRYIIGRVLLLAALVAGVYVGAHQLEARPLDLIVYITVAYALVDKVRATVAEACRLKADEAQAERKVPKR